MLIREMSQGDVEYSVQLAKDMHHESWFSHYDFDINKARQLWDRKGWWNDYQNIKYCS